MANARVGTYDPKRIIVIYGGLPITGFVDGTFVNIVPSTSERFTKQVGADGEVMRTKSNDNTYTVDITLMQSSDSNDVLDTALEIDSGTGANLLPLSITDLNGGSLFFAPQVWLDVPEWGFANTNTDRAWTFTTGQAAATKRSGSAR